MTKFTNQTNLPLSVAVWLATDDYEYPPEDGKKYISATTLMKSTRQIILGNRMPSAEGDRTEDLQSRVASRYGTAIHDGIERAWLNNYQEAMKNLGYPQAVIDRVVVNPDTPAPNSIPVYMEQRFYKEVGDWVVTGQFDFVGDGRLEDFKSTSTFVYQNGVKDEDYIQQGSIYRWGRSDIITEDVMAIQFFFKDWQRFKVNDKNYPSAALLEKTYRLKSVEDTDKFIKNKLFQLDILADTPEPDLPLCSPKELWMRGGSVWKYYKDPTKRTRATKNFDNPAEANLRFVKDGSKGIVVEQKPEPAACRYCQAFSLCSQKDQYIASGLLKV